MINKSELMLGNLLRDSVSRQWVVVGDIGPNLSATLLNKELEFVPPTIELDPIPITRAGLLHIGFEVVERSGGGLYDSEVWSKDRRFICFMPKDGAVLYKYRQNADGSYEAIILQYIHQVQNLYTVLSYQNDLPAAVWPPVLDTPAEKRTNEEEAFHRFNASDPPPMERADKDPKKSYMYHLVATLRGLYGLLPIIALIVSPPIAMVIITGSKLWLLSVVISLPAGIALTEYWDANLSSK